MSGTAKAILHDAKSGGDLPDRADMPADWHRYVIYDEAVGTWYGWADNAQDVLSAFLQIPEGETLKKGTVHTRYSPSTEITECEISRHEASAAIKDLEWPDGHFWVSAAYW